MKRIVFLGIVIILVIIILRLATSIYTLWHKQDLLQNAKLELTQEQKEHTHLVKQLQTVNSPQFLDEQARDRLLLVKPGEESVMIDSNLLKASSSASQKIEVKPFWQQWLDIFFN